MRPADFDEGQTTQPTNWYQQSQIDQAASVITSWTSHSPVFHGVVRPSTTAKPLPPSMDSPVKNSFPDHSLGVTKPGKLNSRGHPLIRLKKPNKIHLNDLSDAVEFKHPNGFMDTEATPRLPPIGSLINTLHLPQETPATLQTQETIEEDHPPMSQPSSNPCTPLIGSPASTSTSTPSPVSDPEQISTLASTTPVKKRTDIDHIIEKTHDMLPAKEDPKFFDITHLLTLPQADAAKAVRLSKPTFCKRWKEAVGSERKWPHRYILKIDREIRQLKSQQKRSGPNKEIQERLNALTLKRKIALTPTAIRL